jgi:hypothetical protein
VRRWFNIRGGRGMATRPGREGSRAKGAVGDLRPGDGQRRGSLCGGCPHARWERAAKRPDGRLNMFSPGETADTLPPAPGAVRPRAETNSALRGFPGHAAVGSRAATDWVECRNGHRSIAFCPLLGLDDSWRVELVALSGSRLGWTEWLCGGAPYDRRDARCDVR